MLQKSGIETLAKSILERSCKIFKNLLVLIAGSMLGITVGNEKVVIGA